MAMAVGFFGRYIRVVQGKPPWDFGRPSALGSARGRRTRGGACRTVVRSLQLRAAWCRKHEKTAGPAGHGQSRADELSSGPYSGHILNEALGCGSPIPDVNLPKADGRTGVPVKIDSWARRGFSAKIIGLFLKTERVRCRSYPRPPTRSDRDRLVAVFGEAEPLTTA
jgi:hypothetical protein